MRPYEECWAQAQAERAENRSERAWQLYTARLFEWEPQEGHSGTLDWKFNCDALSDRDIEQMACLLVPRLPRFGLVEGIPRGGLRLAEALLPYRTEGPLLLVDDVWTTGRSMWEAREKNPFNDVIGAVLLARSATPGWVTALFEMKGSARGQGSKR